MPAKKSLFIFLLLKGGGYRTNDAKQITNAARGAYLSTVKKQVIATNFYCCALKLNFAYTFANNPYRIKNLYQDPPKGQRTPSESPSDKNTTAEQ